MTFVQGYIPFVNIPCKSCLNRRDVLNRIKEKEMDVCLCGVIVYRISFTDRSKVTERIDFISMLLHSNQLTKLCLRLFRKFHHFFFLLPSVHPY